MATEVNVYKEVWDVLSKVDVSEHTEEKAGLTYLSWAWAWDLLMRSYPDAEYEFLDEKFFPDGSCTVECIVCIRGKTRSMWLPVMDYRNNAIENPSSREISDSRMRCLVKCLGMFGLGSRLFTGDLAVPHAPPAKKKAEPKKASKKKASTKSAVDIAKEALGAKEIPDLGLIKNAETIDSLREIFTKNREDYEALGDKMFAVIRKEFNDRKTELKKGTTNGPA